MESTEPVVATAVCPKCGGQDFLRPSSQRFNKMFQLLWPLAWFHEVLLGIRTAKLTLLCKNCDLPASDCVYILCPTCHQMNSERLWIGKNAKGHWFGLVCKSCGGVIPCLWSYSSLLLLGITFPIWFLPVRLLKPSWVELEKRRIAKAIPKPVTETKWWAMALQFGCVMWAILFVRALFSHPNLNVKDLIAGLIGTTVGCTVGSLLFAITMRWMMTRRAR